MSYKLKYSKVKLILDGENPIRSYFKPRHKTRGREIQSALYLKHTFISKILHTEIGT